MLHRRELDGLRAVAVLPVLFYHAGFTWMPGGFLGVDVFFVLSGYLITSLLVAERAAGSFSLAGFYLRRARRLLPALLLVCACCVLPAWLWMLPDDLENFGQSLFATQLFSNNLLLTLTTSYFALENEFKPLFHTWSLGVEEQFYLLYPLLLLLVLRWRRSVASILLAVLVVAGFVAALWSWQRQGELAYLLLPFRSWELLAGAMLALAPVVNDDATTARPWRAEILAVSGAVLLAVTMLQPFDDWQWPLPALIPVVGTLLLLRFATGRTQVGQWLSLRPLVALGLISYGLYLWHQPILVALRLSQLEPPSIVAKVAALILAVVIAALSWRYVEQPLRRGAAVSSRQFVTGCLICTLLLGGCGMWLHLNAGFPGRWNELSSSLERAGLLMNAEYNLEPLRYTEHEFSADNRKKVLIVGSSFARDLINAADENRYFNTSDVVLNDYVPGCELPWDSPDRFSAQLLQADFVIVAVPRMNLECLPETIEQLGVRSTGKVIVIGTKNFGWNYTAAMHLPASEKYQYRSQVAEEDWQYNEQMRALLDEQTFVDVIGMLADEERKVAIFTPEHELISQDRRHLTPPGARYLGRLLFEHPLLAPLR